MVFFFNIVRFDYLQRVRSYAFLIILAISVYVAYAFIPLPGAGYTTLRIGNYTGVQNAAWIGYVTAMMTSVILSMFGFYLVNSNILKDVRTGAGMIIAASPVTNFCYLFAKACSNLLILLSIAAVVFFMGIALFFFRGKDFPFEISQFLLPYLFITLPVLFFIAALAVAGEVFVYRNTIVLNIGYFFLFGVVMSLQSKNSVFFDFFGFRQVFAEMQGIISHRYHETGGEVSMGFIFSPGRHFNYFEFKGVHWGIGAVLSRVLLACAAFPVVFISSLFFHRFDIKEKFKIKKKGSAIALARGAGLLNRAKLASLPPVILSFGIFPVIKTELLMLVRKGPRWLWLVNFGGMAGLAFAPVILCHQLILPLLWFLQVVRLSDLASKEKTYRVHYFTYAAYKPLTRVLSAQIIAGIILVWALALPILIRLITGLDYLSALGVFIGGAFIVLFAVASGILSGGNKLFEVLFFLFTYANIEKMPFADYYGGQVHSPVYLALIFGLAAILALISFIGRKWELTRA